jgi:hypothetical protein
MVNIGRLDKMVQMLGLLCLLSMLSASSSSLSLSILQLFSSVSNSPRILSNQINSALKHVSSDITNTDSKPICNVDANGIRILNEKVPVNQRGKILIKRPRKPKQPIRIHTIDELRDHIAQGYRVRDLDVRGDVYRVLFENNASIHPVVRLLYERKQNNSTAQSRTDGKRVAIAVEGGGMRGCVAAGMISAVWYLGLQDSVDVVYGSSAGSLVGAYFIAKQLPYFGPEVYYDVLTSAGKEFIDRKAVLRSCGLGLLDLRPRSLRAFFTDR